MQCAGLVSASATCVESTFHPDFQAPVGVCLCTCAAVKLRLIEHCGCSKVQGGGGSKVRARLCILVLGGECLPPRPGTWAGVCLCIKAAVNLRLIEHLSAASPRCEVEADSSCVICLASGTTSWVESACRCVHAGVCLCNTVATVKLRLIKHLTAAAPRCEAEADSGCVLASASWHLGGVWSPPRPGTCMCFDFATQPT